RHLPASRPPPGGTCPRRRHAGYNAFPGRRRGADAITYRSWTPATHGPGACTGACSMRSGPLDEVGAVRMPRAGFPQAGEPSTAHAAGPLSWTIFQYSPTETRIE